ncbi:hypothetical protein [Sphingobacterium sp. HSC-15S19]|uniref:hypothetical protein n=1 Tax=Sphingobacterium sp. HSC-15S19 TaxID=2910971 RepID=UPI003D21F61B
MLSDGHLAVGSSITPEESSLFEKLFSGTLSKAAAIRLSLTKGLYFKTGWANHKRMLDLFRMDQTKTTLTFSLSKLSKNYLGRKISAIYPMELKIYFTGSEKMTFLLNRGWRIYEKTVNRHESLHGSRFIELDEQVWYAQKGDEELEMERAFVKELKHKLIFE